MGAYIYRVTAKRVRCSDGKEANIAVYAYKPYMGLGGDKENKRMHFESGCTASDRMAKLGRVTDRVVIGRWKDNGLTLDAENVYLNPGIGHFYDDYDLGKADCMPLVPGITAINPVTA